MHSWMFLRREDLPAGVRIEQPRGYRVFVPHPDDVVVVVKHFVWQAHMAQSPLVVLPNALRRSAGALTAAIRPPKAPKHADEWTKYAEVLARLWPDDPAYARASEYLLALARGQRGLAPVEPLPWHQAASTADLRPPAARIAYSSAFFGRMLPPGRVKVHVRH